MANISTYTDIDLELYESQSVTVIQKQGDEESRYIRIRLIDNDGEEVSLDGVVATFSMATSKNVGFLYSSIGTDSRVVISGNRVIVKLSKNMLSDSGMAQAEIKLTDNTSLLSSTKFYIYIEPSVTSNTFEASDDYKTLTDIVKYAKASESYAIGDTDYREGESTDNAKYYYEKTSEASSSAIDAEAIVAEMKTSVEASVTTATTAATTATTKANVATTASSTATTKADESSSSAKLSKSYAVGGTGTRTNEDTDNSKYYSEKAYEYMKKTEKLTPSGYDDLVKDVASLHDTATTSKNGLMSSTDKTKLDGIVDPMSFKGSLGTGGTITSLPEANKSKGFTYKVITAGTYAGQSAKVGDTFISDGTTWVLIPSGDEPSGTVTSVKVEGTNGISGSGTVTTSGTITLSNSGVRSITQDSSDGHKIKINTNGTESTITIPDNNTTYSNFVKSGIGAAAGLVPAPSTTAGTTKYLREDGTWEVPPGGSLNVQSDWNVTDATSDAYIKNKPTIPTKVSELTNDSGYGTYTKPSTGIPKSDLGTDVQTSLGKADTALQSYTEKYKGTITEIKMNGASKGTSGSVDLGTVLSADSEGKVKISDLYIADIHPDESSGIIDFQGDVEFNYDVTFGNDITFNKGIDIETGDIFIKDGSFYTSNGNVYTNSGDVYTEKGDVYSSSGNIYSKAGDVSTEKGNIYTGNGDVIVYDAETGEAEHYLSRKQDKLTAGTNITIDSNNVISATGGGSSSEYGHKDKNYSGVIRFGASTSEVSAFIQSRWGYDYIKTGNYITMIIHAFSLPTDSYGRCFKYTLPFKFTNGTAVIINQTLGNCDSDTSGFNNIEVEWEENSNGSRISGSRFSSYGSSYYHLYNSMNCIYVHTASAYSTYVKKNEGYKSTDYIYPIERRAFTIMIIGEVADE